MTPPSTTATITVGTRFRSTIADDNALWEVTRIVDAHTVRAVVVNEPIEINGRFYDSDHAGVERPFDTATIANSLALASVFAEVQADRARFWDTIKIGTVLHYADSKNRFVRGEIAEQDGQKVLIPTALLGEWHPWEAATRTPTGEIAYGYHAQKIIAGEGWRPAPDLLVENGNEDRYPGLRDATEVSLVLPPMTPAEEDAASTERALADMRRILDDHTASPQHRLDRIAERIKVRVAEAAATVK